MIKTLKKLRYKYLPIENFLPKRSYAQEGEDLILQSIFGKKKDKGFFVDIGAHHPYRFSNTYLLYKKGWHGINIEPTPSLISSFYRFRKRDINLNIGIGDSIDTLTFYCFNEPALNTFSKETAQSYLNDKYEIIEEKSIPIRPLKNILSENLNGNKIDLLTIDVEGLDLAVLKSNDWEKFKPRIILIEETQKIFIDELSEIQSYLNSKGYRPIAKTTRTSFFLLEDCKNEFFKA